MIDLLGCKISYFFLYKVKLNDTEMYWGENCRPEVKLAKS